MTRPFLRCLVLIALSLPPAGCNVAGALLSKTVGPPATPARYTPPPDQPMLVMVENRHSATATAPEADELASTIRQELAEKKVAPMIELEKFSSLRDRSPLAYRRMSISEVGRQVGARQVLYIELRRLELDTPPGSDVVRLKMAAAVKMIDVHTAQTRFPDHDEGELLEHVSPLERITPEMSAPALKRRALRVAGSEIARLFYKHQAETLSEENKELRLR